MRRILSLGVIVVALSLAAGAGTPASAAPATRAQAHELGLPVIPWTVSEPVDIRTMMDLGVDGTITDYPTRMRNIMAERGLKLPKPYTL